MQKPENIISQIEVRRGRQAALRPSASVLPVGPAPLEILGPEILVLHLVDGQSDEVEGGAAEEGLKLGDGVDLHTEF